MRQLSSISFLFITAIFLHGSTGFAQKIKVHPHGGVHASSVNTTNDTLLANQNMKGGYNVGMDLRLGGYNSWIYLQPGAHFYQARMEIYSLEEFLDEENYRKAEMQVSQLKVPLNLGFYVTGTDGLLKVRASAGVTPSMIVEQSETDLPNEDTQFQTFGVGVNAGIGIDLAILTVDLRYEYGSTKIYKSANANMNFLSLTAGFIIPPTF